MSIDLYYHPMSTPVRAVLMTASALGVNLNLKELNLLAGEHLKPDFVKMNPQHTVPFMDDNGFYLGESRAIMQYLVNAYGKNDSLYPKPAKQRALVDHRLYFDMGSLFKSFVDAYVISIFTKVPVSPENVEKLNNNLEILDELLDKTKFSAGDSLTIADFSLVATLSTIEAVGHKLNKFLKVTAYLTKCKSEIKKYDELNGNGAKQFGEFAKTALAAL